MLELGIVVALALAIWLAVAKPVKFTGFAAKAGAAADEAIGGVKEGHKKMLGKVVKLGLAALAVAFILYYDWSSTAVGKRLVNFLGTENADLFDTLVMGPMLLAVALLLYKSWDGSKGGSGLNISWTTILTVGLVVAIVAFAINKTAVQLTVLSNGNPYAYVNLHHAKLKTPSQDGEPEVVEMFVEQTARVLMRPPRYPNVVEACPKVTKPGKLPDNLYFEVVAGKGTSENHIRLTEESQEILTGYGIKKITVAWLGILRPQQDGMHCQTYK